MLSVRVVVAVLVRPWLWWTAIVQVARLTPRRWWMRPPHLPVPPAEYLEFRLVTQYGGSPDPRASNVRPGDVLDYLRWCRTWNRGR